MKTNIIFYSSILIISLLTSSLYFQKTTKPIVYEYKGNIVAVLDSVEYNVANSFLKKDKEQEMQLFVKMGSYNKNTTLIFNYIENMPFPVQEQISQSNRFLELGEEGIIPILFDFDDGNTLVRKGGVNHGNIGGFLVEFDNYGNVVITSMVY